MNSPSIKIAARGCGIIPRVVLTLSTEVKTMISNMEPGALSARKNASMWEVSSPEEVPLYSLVPVRGPEGELLDGYRGVQRQDTKRVVSIVGERYQLVQTRSTGCHQFRP